VRQYAVELRQMADAARQSQDAEARAQTGYLETVGTEHAAPAMWEGVL
jgi:hypothetical protein